MARYVINEITDWEKDEAAVAGDMSHAPESEVLSLYAEEYRQKVENGRWEGLPFTCEAADTLDALDEYIRQYCEYDYIKPTFANIELITE